MAQPTDFLLLQCRLDGAQVPRLAAAAEQFCAQNPVPVQLHRLAWSAQAGEAYLYARLDVPTPLDADALAPLADLFLKALPEAQDVRVSRLELVFAREGHSRVEAPVFHYVVEMDPDTGWMPEIARWYDTEHMPGLAAVPGCIHAMRLLNHDHGPLSLACYDLVSKETLGSPPWLAVRGTAWSDITRPHFTNTKRTMFEVVPTTPALTETP
jgi:hypothetical protein